MNVIRLLVDTLNPLIDNWGDVAPALVERIAADLLRYPDDEELRALHAHAGAALPRRGSGPARPPGRVVCPRFRFDGRVVRTVTVAARFESTADVTLDELRVELIYPEDAAADRFFKERAPVDADHAP